jgi:predicted dehydrogenase
MALSDKKIKVSVIGSGGWGNRVVRKLHDLCGVHLVYGHKNREQLQKDLGIKFTEDIDELINQSDAVVIAAPPMVHYELGKKVLKAGKDLWMEKPMSMSSTEATKLAKMADESGLIILVGHILCYSQNMEEFKNAGKIKQARGVSVKISSEEKILNSHWNLGIHIVAIAVVLGVDMDKFTLETSHSALKEERAFTIETEDGKTITWDILSPDKRQDMLLQECKHFLECIKTRKQPLTNGWHGVEVVKIMERLSPNPFQGL